MIVSFQLYIYLLSGRLNKYSSKYLFWSILLKVIGSKVESIINIFIDALINLDLIRCERQLLWLGNRIPQVKLTTDGG